jgi:hypothetical protein
VHHTYVRYGSHELRAECRLCSVLVEQRNLRCLTVCCCCHSCHETSHSCQLVQRKTAGTELTPLAAVKGNSRCKTSHSCSLWYRTALICSLW